MKLLTIHCIATVVFTLLFSSQPVLSHPTVSTGAIDSSNTAPASDAQNAQVAKHTGRLKTQGYLHMTKEVRDILDKNNVTTANFSHATWDAVRGPIYCEGKYRMHVGEELVEREWWNAFSSLLLVFGGLFGMFSWYAQAGLARVMHGMLSSLGIGSFLAHFFGLRAFWTADGIGMITVVSLGMVVVFLEVIHDRVKHPRMRALCKAVVGFALSSYLLAALVVEQWHQVGWLWLAAFSLPMCVFALSLIYMCAATDQHMGDRDLYKHVRSWKELTTMVERDQDRYGQVLVANLATPAPSESDSQYESDSTLSDMSSLSLSETIPSRGLTAREYEKRETMRVRIRKACTIAFFAPIIGVILRAIDETNCGLDASLGWTFVWGHGAWHLCVGYFGICFIAVGTFLRANNVGRRPRVKFYSVFDPILMIVNAYAGLDKDEKRQLKKSPRWSLWRGLYVLCKVTRTFPFSYFEPRDFAVILSSVHQLEHEMEMGLAKRRKDEDGGDRPVHLCSCGENGVLAVLTWRWVWRIIRGSTWLTCWLLHGTCCVANIVAAWTAFRVVGKRLAPTRHQLARL